MAAPHRRVDRGTRRFTVDLKETCQSRRGTKAIQKRYKSKTFLLFSEAALRDYVYSFLDSRGLMSTGTVPLGAVTSLHLTTTQVPSLLLVAIAYVNQAIFFDVVRFGSAEF